MVLLPATGHALGRQMHCTTYRDRVGMLLSLVIVAQNGRKDVMD